MKLQIKNSIYLNTLASIFRIKNRIADGPGSTRPAKCGSKSGPGPKVKNYESENGSGSRIKKISDLDAGPGPRSGPAWTRKLIHLMRLRVNVRIIQSGAEQGPIDLSDLHVYSTVFHADSRGAIRFSKFDCCSGLR